MFEWLGIELDPSGLAILANPIGFFAAFSFPPLYARRAEHAGCATSIFAPAGNPSR